MKMDNFLKTLTAEEHVTYTSKLMWFGELPDKRKYSEILDDDFVVSYKNMKSENDVRYALMLAQEVNAYIDLLKLDENSIEYDDLCFFCELQFANIMRYWFGFRTYKQEKHVILELLRDTFWDFMRGDIKFDEFKSSVTKYNTQYISD